MKTLADFKKKIEQFLSLLKKEVERRNTPVAPQEGIDYLASLATESKPVAAKKKGKEKQDIELPGLEKSLVALSSYKKEIKALETTEEQERSELLPVAIEKFIELYKKHGVYPGSFFLKDGIACILVEPEDKYHKLSDEAAAELREKYGNEMVKTEVVLTFNTDVLLRNQKMLPELIKVIPEADRTKLFEKKTKYKIVKGTIENLLPYGDKMINVISDISPTFQLRECAKKADGGGIEYLEQLAAEKKAGAKKEIKYTATATGIEQKLMEFQNVKEQIALLNALKDGITDELRITGVQKFIELYKKDGAYPGSFYIRDGEGCIMIIPQDRYSDIKEADRIEELRKMYGDIVKTETEYSFRPDTLKRNEAAISEFIKKTDLISPEDKKQLFKKQVNNTIAEGTIKRLVSFENMGDVIADISPIFALKNCGGLNQ